MNAWNDYHNIRNKITSDIQNVHTKYQTNLFNKNGKTNHKNFWKYIKNICKDQLSVPPLNHDGNAITSSNEKPNILNSKFQSVFTCENTTDMTYFTTTNYPTHCHHPLQHETPFAKSNHYKFSYFPKSINDWNHLFIKTIESPSLQLFIERLLWQLTNYI